MKKYIHFIIFGFGIVVMIIVGFFVFKNKKIVEVEDDLSIPELAIKDMPFVSLIPDSEGHYLKLKIENINIEDAKTLEYNLLYQTENNVTQGVPGTVELKQNSFETDLLLGSESSGKYRYDEGVQSGSLSLSFRNDSKKLVAKMSTNFSMLESPEKMSFSQELVNLEFQKNIKGFVLFMNTLGLPLPFEKNIVNGPYGIFSSAEIESGIKININNLLYRWNESTAWEKIDNPESIGAGIYVVSTD